MSDLKKIAVVHFKELVWHVKKYNVSFLKCLTSRDRSMFFRYVLTLSCHFSPAYAVSLLDPSLEKNKEESSYWHFRDRLTIIPCWKLRARNRPVDLAVSVLSLIGQEVWPCYYHRLDSLGGKSTFVTMVTTVTMSSVVIMFVSLCIWIILSSTQPADNRASASWSQHSSIVSQSIAIP